MEHLDYCEQQTGLFITQLLDSCWRDLDTRLYERCQAIKDPTQRTDQINAMQEVRFKADQAAANLASQNQLNYLRYRDNLALRHRDESSPSSAPPIAGLEDSLAINSAISDMQQEQRHPLWQINKRMALLRGGIISEEHDNPLAPASICLAFQNMVLNLEVNAHIRLVLYEIFGKAFCGQAPAFYDRLNRYLTESGVLPNLLQSIKPSVPPAPGEQGSSANQPLASNEQRLERILRAIECDLQWPAQINKHFSASTILPIECYGQAVRDIQPEITKSTPAGTLKEHSPCAALTEYHRQLIFYAQRHAAGLNRGLLLLAELVTQLFTWLDQQNSIATPIKPLLRTLYTPILGLAITDRSFFLRNNHPGRLLLDAVCFHGSLWCDHPDTQGAILSKLLQLTNRLASSPQYNRPLFEQCWTELDEFLRDRQSRAELTEQRCIQTWQSLHALNCAHDDASAMVSHSLTTHKVSSRIADMLAGPCSEFLTFILLRQGYGKHWEQACQLMDGIAMSVKGQLPSEQLMPFQRGQQRLVKATRASLASLGYQGLLAQDLLNTLRIAQAEALACLATESTEQRPHTASRQPAAPQPRLQHLQTGHWYRFSEAGEVQTSKLAWRSATHFLFVDVMGNECRTLDAEETLSAWDSQQLISAPLPAVHSGEAFLDSMPTAQPSSWHDRAPG